MSVRVAVGEQLDDALVGRPLDQDPAAGAAVLAGVVEDRVRRLAGELLEVGVGEDDVRALAAELERDLLHVARGQPHDLLPGRGLAGERDLADARVGRDRRAGRAARPGHDVEDAGRDAGLERELAETDRGQRRVRGGLEDRGVPGGQGRRDLPRGHEDREVPRHDEPDDADRLAQREVEARASRPGSSGRRPCWRRPRSSRRRGWPRRPRRALPEIGLPTFRLSSWASSSLCSLSRAANFASVRPRLPAAQFAQPLRSSKAACAAATARSTSSRPPSGAVAMTAPVGRVDDLERLAVGGVDGLAADDHLGCGRGDGGRLAWSCQGVPPDVPVSEATIAAR